MTHQLVGNGTHDGVGLLRDSLSKSLLADNDRAVHASRRSAVRSRVHAGRLNEVRALDRADEAGPEVLRRVVLVEILEPSTRGLLANIEGNLRMDVGSEQAALTRNSKVRTQLRHDETNIVKLGDIRDLNLAGLSRSVRRVTSEADIAAATKLSHHDRVKRVSHVVSDDVGSSRINVRQAEQAQLAGEQSSVAVLVQSHGDRAGVAHRNSIRINVLRKGAGRLSQISIDLEHNGRTRHGLLHRTLISNVTDERLRTQSHLNVAIVSRLHEVSHASLVGDRASTSIGVSHC